PRHAPPLFCPSLSLCSSSLRLFAPSLHDALPISSALQDDLQTPLFTGDGPNSPEPDMSWTILVIAGLLEVVWAVGLKYTHGFSRDRKSTRLNSSHASSSYAVFCLQKKKAPNDITC